MYEHIILAEMKIGRLLEDGEVVHHEDEDKMNNDPGNLEVKTRSSHAKGHAKTVTMVELECAFCEAAFTRRKGNEPSVKGYKRAFCSRRCNGKFHTTVSVA